MHCFLFVCAFYFSKWQILIRGQEELNATVSRPGASKSQPLVAAETVKIDAGSIVVQGLIKEGEFGHVHQGTWKRDSSVKVRDLQLICSLLN